MADQFGGAFGGYSNITQVISAAAKTAIKTELHKLRDLVQDPAIQSNRTTTPYPNPGPSPDFDKVHPQLARQLRVEHAALDAAIDAAPTS